MNLGKAGVKKKENFVYIVAQAFEAVCINNVVSFVVTLGGSEIRYRKSYGI